LLQTLIDYLAQKPYIEVHQLIHALGSLPEVSHEAVLAKEEPK